MPYGSCAQDRRDMLLLCLSASEDTFLSVFFVEDLETVKVQINEADEVQINEVLFPVQPQQQLWDAFLDACKNFAGSISTSKTVQEISKPLPHTSWLQNNLRNIKRLKVDFDTELAEFKSLLAEPNGKHYSLSHKDAIVLIFYYNEKLRSIEKAHNRAKQGYSAVFNPAPSSRKCSKKKWFFLLWLMAIIAERLIAGHKDNDRIKRLDSILLVSIAVAFFFLICIFFHDLLEEDVPQESQSSTANQALLRR